jgi:pilus assembly protein Flp/PilA
MSRWWQFCAISCELAPVKGTAMKGVANFLRDFARAKDGATAMEYALIAAGISLVIIVAAGAIGNSLNTSFYAKIVEGLSSL